MSASDAFPRRPPRIMPFQDVRPFYFLTFCTRDRRAILACAEVHGAFIRFAARAHDEHAVAVGRYVIMPDHIHLFVVFPEIGPRPRLGRWVGQLKRQLGIALEGLDQKGPFWQEGFFDHLMRGADSYSEKWAYVRQNPRRAGLCESEEDWLYAGEIVSLRF